MRQTFFLFWRILILFDEWRLLRLILSLELEYAFAFELWGVFGLQ